MSAEVHRFTAAVEWSGSTGGGYEAYGRVHRVRALPEGPTVTVTSAPGFGGDPALLNPEQLLVQAVASCQLLTFLAIAARSRVEVLAYEDRAEALMPVQTRGSRISAVALRPRITVAPGTSPDRVLRLVAKAHDGCIVANSVAFPVEVEPAVLVAERPPVSSTETSSVTRLLADG